MSASYVWVHYVLDYRQTDRQNSRIKYEPFTLTPIKLPLQSAPYQSGIAAAYGVISLTQN